MQPPRLVLPAMLVVAPAATGLLRDPWVMCSTKPLPRPSATTQLRFVCKVLLQPPAARTWACCNARWCCACGCRDLLELGITPLVTGIQETNANARTELLEAHGVPLKRKRWPPPLPSPLGGTEAAAAEAGLGGAAGMGDLSGVVGPVPPKAEGWACCTRGQGW